MNSKFFFAIILILAGAIIFRLTTQQKLKTSATAASKTEIPSQISTLSAQTKTMGAVEVEVRPISVESGNDVVFELSMNTHSVELNYDYKQIATLLDEQGNTYTPTQWTGGNSGHHLEGQLVFGALSQNPKELTLTLDGVDNTVETFSWQL